MNIKQTADEIKKRVGNLMDDWEEINWIFRQHEDAFDPRSDLPDWAKCINGDIEYQRKMGAFKCDDCGMEVGHNEFYCPDCKKKRADKKKLEKKLEERCKTLKLME